MKKTILVFSFILISSILYSIEITEDGVLFEYDDENAQSVFLVGSMNDWDTTETPMDKSEDGVWRILLKLDYGDYTYKFIVDGNWQLDQENPNFEDDGYGGSNSVIKYSSGFDANKYNTNNSDGVKSSFNPKIYFKGQYFSNNVFIKNETSRFMLDKPEHDLNFGIKVKFNSDLEGYTILNVNNNKEESEMWRTHFNYKRSYLSLKADYINITAFDNIGIISFDDPLHIVGDMGYNKYSFGYNHSGLYAETSNKFSKLLPVDILGQVLFSDKAGYSEDDVSAMRVKLSSPIFDDDKLIVGASQYQYTTKLSEQFIQRHDNQEFDVTYQKDILRSGWKDAMRFSVSAEYSEYENSNTNSTKDIWMEGHNIYIGASIKFPAALNIYANYINSSLSMSDNSSIDKINVGATYHINNFKWSFNARHWKNNISDDLSWVDYYKYFEKTDGNGRWFQEYSEVPFQRYTLLGYETGILWESKLSYNFNLVNRPLKAVLVNKFAHHDLFVSPKFVESIVVFEYSVSDKWILKTDTRVPYYNDPFLGLKTNFSDDEDVFVDNYLEISYHLSDDVWISLGYGLNPFSMDTETDQFHYRGREEYLDSAGGLPSHLESYYGGLGEKIREAENSLMDEKRISIQAIIRF